MTRYHEGTTLGEAAPPSSVTTKTDATSGVGDLSEFYTLVKARGPICSVRLILDRLTPEQSDKFRAAMATKSIPATIIAKVVTGWLPEGEVLRHDPVRRHRDGQCACPT